MFFPNFCNESAFGEDPERGRSSVLSSPLCLRNCSSPASSFPFLEAPLLLEFASIRCETDNKRSAKLFSRQLLITREKGRRRDELSCTSWHKKHTHFLRYRMSDSHNSKFFVYKKWLK